MRYAMSFLAAAAVLSAVTASGAAQTGGGAIVVDYGSRAIEKGYGDMCSLEMVPVKAGGYYHCLDFGPYRFVEGYQSVSAYVVVPGKLPFRVMGGTADAPAFEVAGPWEVDMALKMAAFWNDTVEGGAEKAKQVEEGASRKSAAEEYINSLTKKPEPPPAPKQAAVAPAPDAPAPDPVLSNAHIGEDVSPADLSSVLKAVSK